MARKTTPPSPLVEAAQTLADELERLRSLVSAGARERLDSARSIERAGAALQQIPEVHSGLHAGLLALAQAFEAARRSQEELADQAQKRAVEISARMTELQTLLGMQGALADDTRQVNDFARTLAGGPATQGLDELHERIAGLVERATALGVRAREAAFPELARSGDALRQQVLSLKNKIALTRAGSHADVRDG